MAAVRARRFARRNLPIIVLAGTNGVGKTTIAHHLSVALNIGQRSSTASMLRTLEAVVPRHPINRRWRYGLQDQTPAVVKRLFRRRSQLYGRIVRRIVSHARKTGQPYIIEGGPLLPEHLPLPSVWYAVITVTDAREHQHRLQHPFGTRTRHLRPLHLPTVRFVDELLVARARACGLPVIDNTGSVGVTVRKLRRAFSL